jgi:hypothetical protein
MRSPLPTRFLTILSRVPQNQSTGRFTIAVATGVLAVLLRGLLDPLLGHVAFYITVHGGGILLAGLWSWARHLERHHRLSGNTLLVC